MPQSTPWEVIPSERPCCTLQALPPSNPLESPLEQVCIALTLLPFVGLIRIEVNLLTYAIEQDACHVGSLSVRLEGCRPVRKGASVIPVGHQDGIFRSIVIAG